MGDFVTERSDRQSKARIQPRLSRRDNHRQEDLFVIPDNRQKLTQGSAVGFGDEFVQGTSSLSS